MTGQPIETTGETKRRRKSLLRRFGRAQEGATAIEFGFVALPFLMLMAAIMETALMLWTSQVLEEAVSQASRSLLTGQSQALYTGSAAANGTAFRNAICSRSPGLIDCSKLTIDVRSSSSFSGAQQAAADSSAVKNGSLNTTGYGFSQPQPRQIVVVRAVLEYNLVFTQWSAALANIGAGKRAIVASSTFRAEPFTAPTT